MVIQIAADAGHTGGGAVPDLAGLAEAHGRGIIKYCYSLLLDYHEAQDAAQDVFLRAAAKLGGLRDSSAVSPWLYRMAYNICINILRRRKLAKLFLVREAAKAKDSSHTDSYDLGISPEIKAALSTLHPRDRALVYSRAVDEMEYSQLEAVYGAKASALRKRYERARKKLEQELIKNGFSES